MTGPSRRAPKESSNTRTRTPARSLGESSARRLADVALPVDEGEEVDRVLGGLDRVEHGGEDLVAVAKHVDPVALGRGDAEDPLERTPVVERCPCERASHGTHAGGGGVGSGCDLRFVLGDAARRARLQLRARARRTPRSRRTAPTAATRRRLRAARTSCRTARCRKNVAEPKCDAEPQQHRHRGPEGEPRPRRLMTPRAPSGTAVPASGVSAMPDPASCADAFHTAPARRCRSSRPECGRTRAARRRP